MEDKILIICDCGDTMAEEELEQVGVCKDCK